MSVSLNQQTARLPQPSAMLEVLKPVTWFPPMWAYLCGAVSAGVPLGNQLVLVFLGVLLAGPLVCGMSQAANDWCDRHVDAINEPHRPIPSGRLPGRWGLWIALVWSAISLSVGALLGPWGLGATIVAVAAAWAYSAEPIRAKKSGWWGPGLCGLSYESLPWFTGAAVMVGAAPAWQTVVIALLYGIGAHGIMTLNDFKALKGDRETGLASLPVVLGPERAARLACWVMGIPQVLVITLLVIWNVPIHAAFVAAALAGQIVLMRRLLTDPKGLAPWYNGTGILLYVSGMMASALALGSMTGATP